jgi:hypothetical protein
MMQIRVDVEKSQGNSFQSYSAACVLKGKSLSIAVYFIKGNLTDTPFRMINLRSPDDRSLFRQAIQPATFV